MAHVYSKKMHFQREEATNIGILGICKSYFFGQGLLDYKNKKEMRDFGDQRVRGVMAQSAYELGRLLGAWAEGEKVKLPKEILIKSGGYLKATSGVQTLALKARHSKSNPFC